MVGGIVITLAVIGAFVAGFVLGTYGSMLYLRNHVGIVWCDGFFIWQDTGTRVSRQKGEQ